MNFSLEIGPHTDLETLPPVKDVYTLQCYLVVIIKRQLINQETLLKKVLILFLIFQLDQLIDEEELKDYVSRCKDQGVKQALVIGGSREPIGKFDSSFQILETGFLKELKLELRVIQREVLIYQNKFRKSNDR